jgi:WD40 repeat protein
MSHEPDVNDIAFSPDGRYIVSGGWDGVVRVWDAATGEMIATMSHDHNVADVAFSPDGRRIVSGSFDKTARVWDAATGDELLKLTYEHFVDTVAVSIDGNYALSVEGSIVYVWEITTGREVARIKHTSPVWVAAFSPDGRWIVSGNGDDDSGTLLVWPWHPDDLLAEACNRVPRNLTQEEWVQYLGPDIPYHATCPGKP